MALPIIVPPFVGARDYTPLGIVDANKLAHVIEQKWRAAGHFNVRVRIVKTKLGESELLSIRSNLLNGLPPVSR